jgi:hypothetical protein
MLVTRDADFLATDAVKKVTSKVEVPAKLSVWTDDFNNLLRIIK